MHLHKVARKEFDVDAVQPEAGPIGNLRKFAAGFLRELDVPVDFEAEGGSVRAEILASRPEGDLDAAAQGRGD